MAKAVDMTTGSPFKRIFFFAIPIALGFMLQNMYSLGDSLIVSLSRGAEAATGVNLTGSLTFLIIGFAQGFSTGFGIALSQFVGAKNINKIKNSIATSLVLSIVISVIVAGISSSLSRFFLELLSTDELFIDYADRYLRVIFIGTPFLMLYNLSDQFLRAMGDSNTPLFILIMCAVLNIGLNSLMFISDVFTVAWAGWATVISQGISSIVGFSVLFKKFPEVRLKPQDFKFTFEFASFHLKMGFPMALQFMVTASGCMIQQKAVNDLGEPMYQMAQATASKIDNIFGIIPNGAGVAMATYVGQNFGAKRFDRIKEGYKKSFLVGAIYTAIAMTLCISLCTPFTKLLLPRDTIIGGDPDLVYNLAFKYNLILSCFYYVLFLVFSGRSCLQAIGCSSLTILGGITETTMRIISAYTLAVWFGFMGTCFSNPMAWFGGAVFFVIAYNISFKKVEKRFSQAVIEPVEL